MLPLDAFDTDVLIYAVHAEHPLGPPIRRLLGETRHGKRQACGSTLLLPELLSKPLRDGVQREIDDLMTLLSHLDLIPADEAVARLAASLGAEFGLKAADACHLATAISAGADRFITNNRKDFPATIPEIDIVTPEDLLRAAVP